MEAVAEESGYLEASKQVAFEQDTVGAMPDEEFDFDIGGTGDNLEEALDVFESTQDGLPYHNDNNIALHGLHPEPLRDQGTHEGVNESHEDDTHGQDQGQHDPEVSAFDDSAGDEGADQAYHFDDGRGGETGSEDAQQAGGARYGDDETYQEDAYLEDTADQLGSFDEVGQQNEEMARSVTVATATVESEHIEDEHIEDDVRDEGFTAQEIHEIQEGDETQPPGESEHDNEIIRNETTEAEPGSVKAAQNTNPGDDSSPVDTTTGPNSAGTTYGLDETGGQEEGSPKSSEQRPRVRVSYGTAEFYLFAESPDANPDDHFFDNADILHRPLSHFLSKLRQVIAEDLQASDELFVKVDGLGLEFGEATTTDFLEHTTFGRVIELYERLVKLDDDSSEAPELYVYLECRPNCLYRLSELTSYADEGKGLSDVAFYYDATPDLAAFEEESNGCDQGRQDMDSEDVSEDGSNDQLEVDLSTTRETEQPYNPFRLSESQQQAMDASHPALAEVEAVNDSLSAHDDEDHITYENDNKESLSREVQDDLELAAAEASHDVAPEAAQDFDMVPGEDEELAAEAANEEAESEYHLGKDVPGREEVAGTEAVAVAVTENDNLQEEDGPTDGEHLSSLDLNECTASSEICACVFCMSSQSTDTGALEEAQAMADSEMQAPVSDPQLVEEALTDVRQAIVAAADWSSNFSTTNAGGPLAGNLDNDNHTQNTSADFNMQDYDIAENDDYLDIGATEEEPPEPAEYPASVDTPEPTSHNSSATATLDGEGQGDDVSATQALADASHLIETASQPEPGPPETETDEIHWNDDDDDENDFENDAVDFANQNQTALSPSSLSVKRGRQADEDDVGLGDDSSESSGEVQSPVCTNVVSVAKRRRT